MLWWLTFGERSWFLIWGLKQHQRTLHRFSQQSSEQVSSGTLVKLMPSGTVIGVFARKYGIFAETWTASCLRPPWIAFDPWVAMPVPCQRWGNDGKRLGVCYELGGYNRKYPNYRLSQLTTGGIYVTTGGIYVTTGGIYVKGSSNKRIYSTHSIHVTPTPLFRIARKILWIASKNQTFHHQFELENNICHL